MPHPTGPAAILAALAMALLPACSSGPEAPSPPVKVGTRLCSDTLHLTLPEDGRQWKPGEVRAVVSNSGESRAPLALPADLVFEREASVYQQGAHPPRVRGTDAHVDVQWKGARTGKWRWHRQEVWVDCGGRRDVEVALPWEVQVRISTDPKDVSVFVLPGRYRTPQYLGTAPMTTTLLVYPRKQQRWGFQLQKAGMRTDTLMVESPRHNQTYRVVLQPLPHTIPPER